MLEGPLDGFLIAIAIAILSIVALWGAAFPSGRKSDRRGARKDEDRLE